MPVTREWLNEPLLTSDENNAVDAGREPRL